MDFLEGLNPQQRQAVAAGAGPTLVLAGPGSGKTRVLTQRVAFLIAEQRVPAYRIMAVTFTNKAAREMRNRVERLLGAEAAQGMWLGTFHSICARLLRREVALLPLESNFAILDQDDQERLVKGTLRDFNLDPKLYRPASMLGAISAAKNELILAEDYPARTYRDEVVKRIYTEYQRRLVTSNAVDFDDLLVYTARMLDENAAVREKYSGRLEHVLVDEFQDTNLAQYAIVRQLASVHGNLFVVGDPDQSIYRWRGADWRNVQRFEEDYPNANVILLEQNYRSRQTILDAAMGVIDQASNRRRKQLFTERGTGEKIQYYEAPDDYAEAAFVVDSIAQLVASRQFEPRDCAVMYRTNAQSRLLEEAFLQARLPYRLVGAQRFYGRREVKDVIAFLRLVHNPADEVSLDRILNVPPRGVGDKTLLGLHTVARENQTSAGLVVLDLARGEDSAYWARFVGRSAVPLADFGSLLAGWVSLATRVSVPEVFDRVLKDLNYKAYIDDESEEGIDRWENVQELRRLALDYSDRTLEEFLETVALVSDQDTIKEDMNAPTLLTLHAAKGLEFGAVFITGLDDGILPHSRSFDEPEEMEEERRLLYVGITRAKDRLYLIRAMRRGGRGFAEEAYPSRFLDDIPAALLLGRAAARTAAGGPRARPSDTLWRDPAVPARSAPPVVERFRAGTRVRHPIWGEGIVLNSRIQDADEIVDVVFESVGLKKLAASLANLVII
ncbi:MAG TPA: UvrD-helicase domain-containing protein [Anaerolineales bacterium]|nr:UvrD-helicase domain-containing protein [Anaerolineales bacterium]